MKVQNRVLTGLLIAVGCGGSDQTGCGDLAAETVAGDCVGVATPTLCSSTFCVPEGVTCTRVHVQEGASGNGSENQPFGDLPAASATAKPGDCIVVAAGTYAGAALPPGVSLFGAGAAQVTIEGGQAGAALSIEGGSGTRIRGVRLGGPGPGLRAVGAADLAVEEVAVVGASEAGFKLTDSEATLRAVTVRGVTLLHTETGDLSYGVYGQGLGRIELTDSLVEGNAKTGIGAIGMALDLQGSLVRDNGGYGVGVQDGVDPSAVASSWIENNSTVGILVSNSRCTLDGVDVASTRATTGAAFLLSVQDGADVDVLNDTHLHDSEKVGVLVDASRLEMVGGEVSNNESRGVWFQNVPAILVQGGRAVRLEGVEVQDNGFVGVGGKESAGIVIVNGIIGRTRLEAVADNGSIYEAGDGLQALFAAELVATGVTLVENERAAALFDGATGGITDAQITVGAGEDSVGMVIQNGAPASGFSGNVDASGDPLKPEVRAEPYEVFDRPFVAPAGLSEVDPV